MTATLLTQTQQPLPHGITLRAEVSPAHAEILTPDALNFLTLLHRKFEAERSRLLQLRRTTQHQIDAGWLPDFPAETADIRAADWKVAPIPQDLQDRRVELTGPTDRKMVINALNSGANTFMADFEDATSPTWETMLSGQVNLRDAVERTIFYRDPKTGKDYTLGSNLAVLIARPRGWHLLEEHLLVDGQPISASLFDFGLYFFHNAHRLLLQGSGPYFYLPKLENRHEAALWNAVFVTAEETLGLAIGTIKATVLIEMILAAFEMDEILYALRDHIVALNCGRWDYIFSFIKKFRNRPDWVLPDRQQVTMTTHFLRSYSLLTIKTCHCRGALAIGGMAAQIPIKANPVANEAALARVRADKEREANDGHDGTWVAHPALVSVARTVFDHRLHGFNQLSVKRDDLQVTAADLLTLPAGNLTETGLRTNIRVGILYLTHWLGGTGCVPLFNLMEDAATAEICRAQIWQWLHHGACLEDGRPIDATLFHTLLTEEVNTVKNLLAERLNSPDDPDLQTHLHQAIHLFKQLVTSDHFVEFLTLPAYRLLTQL